MTSFYVFQTDKYDERMRRLTSCSCCELMAVQDVAAQSYIDSNSMPPADTIASRFLLYTLRRNKQMFEFQSKPPHLEGIVLRPAVSHALKVRRKLNMPTWQESDSWSPAVSFWVKDPDGPSIPKQWVPKQNVCGRLVKIILMHIKLINLVYFTWCWAREDVKGPWVRITTYQRFITKKAKQASCYLFQQEGESSVTGTCTPTSDQRYTCKHNAMTWNWVHLFTSILLALLGSRKQAKCGSCDGCQQREDCGACLNCLDKT